MTLVHRQTLKKKTRDLYLFLPVPTCHAHPSRQSPPSFPPITCQPPSSLPSHHVVILNLQLSRQPPPSSPPITPSSLSNCHMSTPLLPPHPSRSPPSPTVTSTPLLPSHPSRHPPSPTVTYYSHLSLSSKCLLQTPHNTTQDTTATATGSVSRPTSPPPSTEPLSGTVACSPETWTQLETGSLPPVLSETHPHTVKAACQGL